MQFIACHGGSASDPRHEDGPRLACRRGLEVLAAHRGALEAVLAATECLEDDERFNAGTGSNLRFDGTTIQMDAACMTSVGDFGAVAAIERVQNPVRVAERVLSTPHMLLAGAGATAFARQCGFPNYDPVTNGARSRLSQIISVRGELGEWSIDALRKAWNFNTPLDSVLGCDTVGAVAWDGHLFASALSSGGTTAVLRGRVGDVPLPGCGLYAGPAGAIAATGDGEHIARSLLAYRAYLRLEDGRASAREVARWALTELDAEVDVGLIVVDRKGYSGAARNGMAWFGRGE